MNEERFAWWWCRNSAGHPPVKYSAALLQKFLCRECGGPLFCQGELSDLVSAWIARDVARG